MSRANPATSHENAGIAAWRFKLKAEIGSYQDCVNFYAAETSPTDFSDEPAKLGPHMSVKPCRRKTTMLTSYYAVVLYETEIIRYYPDGTFSVDNGGFNTPTTLYRLSAVLPPRWMVFHYRKQLKLIRLAEDGYTQAQTIWPATHERRVKT